MSKYGLDFEQVGGDYTPITDGTYAVILSGVKQKEVGANNTPKIECQFTIYGGEFNARDMWHDLWLTDKGYNVLATQLNNVLIFKKIQEAAAKVGGFDLKRFGDAAFKCLSGLKGKKFQLDIKYDGKNDKGYTVYKTFLHSYIDTPNAAVQVPQSKEERAGQAQSSPKPVPRDHSQSAGFDANEEIPF